MEENVVRRNRKLYALRIRSQKTCRRIPYPPAFHARREPTSTLRDSLCSSARATDRDMASIVGETLRNGNNSARQKIACGLQFTPFLEARSGHPGASQNAVVDLYPEE